MKKIILILFLFLTINLYAQESFLDKELFGNWTVQDTILQILYGNLLLLDGLYTAKYMKTDKIIELNPFLGENPSTQKIIIYGSIFFTFHTIFICLLPNRYRTIYQSICIGIVIETIYRNYHVVARYKF